MESSSVLPHVGHLEIAVVTPQALRGAMLGQGHAARGALDHRAAVQTAHRCRVAASIQEENALAFVIQALADRAAKRAAEEWVLSRSTAVAFEIDALDCRKLVCRGSLGQREEVETRAFSGEVK